MNHPFIATIAGVAFFAALPVFGTPPTSDRSIWYSYSKEQPLTERTLNYDLTKLMKLPPAAALKELDRFRGACTKAAPERPVHMPLLDAAVWTAYNPALPAYIEEKIKEYPITYENAFNREQIFFALATLPAEWAARILIREAQVTGEVVTSSKHDLTDDEVILELMLAQDDDMSPNPRELTNAKMALDRLYDMKLPGISGRPEEMSVQDWLAAKEPDLAKLVKAKWGKYAVLNVDLGLGPDSGKRVDRHGTTTPDRPDRRLHDSASQSPDEARTATRWAIPALAVLALLATAIGWWYMKSRTSAA
jgi:hypothetical protein